MSAAAGRRAGSSGVDAQQQRVSRRLSAALLVGAGPTSNNNSNNSSSSSSSNNNNNKSNSNNSNNSNATSNDSATQQQPPAAAPYQTYGSGQRSPSVAAGRVAKNISQFLESQTFAPPEYVHPLTDVVFDEGGGTALKGLPALPRPAIDSIGGIGGENTNSSMALGRTDVDFATVRVRRAKHGAARSGNASAGSPVRRLSRPGSWRARNLSGWSRRGSNVDAGSPDSISVGSPSPSSRRTGGFLKSPMKRRLSSVRVKKVVDGQHRQQQPDRQQVGVTRASLLGSDNTAAKFVDADNDGRDDDIESYWGVVATDGRLQATARSREVSPGGDVDDTAFASDFDSDDSDWDVEEVEGRKAGNASSGTNEEEDLESTTSLDVGSAPDEPRRSNHGWSAPDTEKPRFSERLIDLAVASLGGYDSEDASGLTEMHVCSELEMQLGRTLTEPECLAVADFLRELEASSDDGVSVGGRDSDVNGSVTASTFSTTSVGEFDSDSDLDSVDGGDDAELRHTGGENGDDECNLDGETSESLVSSEDKAVSAAKVREKLQTSRRRRLRSAPVRRRKTGLLSATKAAAASAAAASAAAASAAAASAAASAAAPTSPSSGYVAASPSTLGMRRASQNRAASLSLHTDAATAAIAAAVAAAEATPSAGLSPKLAAETVVPVSQFHGVKWSFLRVGDELPQSEVQRGCSLFFEPAGGILRVCTAPATASPRGRKRKGKGALDDGANGSGDGAWTVALLDCRGAYFDFAVPGMVAITPAPGMTTAPRLAVGADNAGMHDDAVAQKLGGGTVGIHLSPQAAPVAASRAQFCHIFELEAATSSALSSSSRRIGAKGPLHQAMSAFRDTFCTAQLDFGSPTNTLSNGGAADGAVEFFCPISFNSSSQRVRGRPGGGGGGGGRWRSSSDRRETAFAVVTSQRLVVISDSYPSELAKRNTFAAVDIALNTLIFSPKSQQPGLLLCMQQRERRETPLQLEIFGRAEDIERLHRALSHAKLSARISSSLHNLQQLHQQHATVSPSAARARVSSPRARASFASLVGEASSTLSGTNKVKRLLGLTPKLRRSVQKKRKLRGRQAIMQTLLEMQHGTIVRLKRVRSAIWSPGSGNNRRASGNRRGGDEDSAKGGGRRRTSYAPIMFGTANSHSAASGVVVGDSDVAVAGGRDGDLHAFTWEEMYVWISADLRALCWQPLAARQSKAGKKGAGVGPSRGQAEFVPGVPGALLPLSAVRDVVEAAPTSERVRILLDDDDAGVGAHMELWFSSGVGPAYAKELRNRNISLHSLWCAGLQALNEGPDSAAVRMFTLPSQRLLEVHSLCEPAHEGWAMPVPLFRFLVQREVVLNSVSLFLPPEDEEDHQNSDCPKNAFDLVESPVSDLLSTPKAVGATSIHAPPTTDGRPHIPAPPILPAPVGQPPRLEQVLPDVAGPVLDFGNTALDPGPHERWEHFMTLAAEGKMDNGMGMHATHRSSKQSLIRAVLDMADVDTGSDTRGRGVSTATDGGFGVNVWDTRWRQQTTMQMLFNTLVIDEPNAQHCLMRWHLYVAKVEAKTHGQWVNAGDVVESLLPPGLIFRFAEYFKDALLSTFMAGRPSDMIVRSTSAHQSQLRHQRVAPESPSESGRHSQLQRRRSVEISSPSVSTRVASSAVARGNDDGGHVFRGLPSSSFTTVVDILKTQLEAVEDELETKRRLSLERTTRGGGGVETRLSRPRALSAVEEQLTDKRMAVSQQLDFVRALSKMVDDLVFHVPKVRRLYRHIGPQALRECSGAWQALTSKLQSAAFSYLGMDVIQAVLQPDEIQDIVRHVRSPSKERKKGGIRIISSGSMGHLQGGAAREAASRSSEAGRSFYLFEAAALALYEGCFALSPHDMVQAVTRMYASIQHEWSWRTARIAGAPKPLTADLLMPISCFVVASLPQHYRLSDPAAGAKTEPYDIPRLCYLLVRWGNFESVFSSGQHSYNVTTLVAAMSHVLLSALKNYAIDGRSKAEYFERALHDLFHFPREEDAADKAAVQFKKECGIDLRLA